MLGALGVGRVALLSNNPDKAAQLTSRGIGVAAQVSTAVHRYEANARYLAAKVHRADHTLDLGAQLS